MTLLYRVQQFRQDVFAGPLLDNAQAFVSTTLTPDELQLFQQFSYSEQWHSYRVATMLVEAGHNQHDLIVAALLHDVGKTKAPISVMERSLIVLAQWFLPNYVGQLGEGEPVGWKRPFVVKIQHPEWGANMAEQAGCSSLAISLIRRHQDPLSEIKSEEDRLLQLLQWADDQN